MSALQRIRAQIGAGLTACVALLSMPLFATDSLAQSFCDANADGRKRFSWFNNSGPFFSTQAEVCVFGRQFYSDPPAQTMALGSDCVCRESGGTGYMYIVPYKFYYFDRYHDRPSCFASGNPIHPLTGTKSHVEDVLGVPISLRLTYDTKPRAPRNDQGLGLAAAPPTSFGELWGTNLHKRLVVQAGWWGSVGAVLVGRGGAEWVGFAPSGSGFSAAADVRDKLSAAGSGWLYFDQSAKSQESYDAAGRLVGIKYIAGAGLELLYSTANTPLAIAPLPGLLIEARDPFGRRVAFVYELPGGASQARIVSVEGVDGTRVSFSYDEAANLSRISYPNATATEESRFLYELSTLPWALTGFANSQARVGTYTYDTNGRALSTELAGGVNRFESTYATPPMWSIVESYSGGDVIRDHYWAAPQGTNVRRPTGAVSAVSTASVLGIPRLSSQSQPAGSGCAASTSSQTYDANGNIASKDDFNGSRVCYANDLSRNLETSRVEGLAGGASGAACSSVTPEGSALPTGARKTSTQWHPDWSKATKVAEPGRIVTSVYNGQPDPFNGGAIALCAPASALLPDGKPIVVLCKQVEQASTDANGGAGFAAAVDATVPARVSQWTYNQFGQVLSASDALNRTTNYVYYSDTAFTGADPNAVGHTLGDLYTVTNAAGHVTQYTQYDKHGNWLQMVDANGVVTNRTFDLRQRLLTVNVGGQLTSYEYWPTGLLKKLTQPDGSFVSYEYDAAQRLVALADNLGNRIEYTLDNAGNRTAENIKDAGGSLRRALSRSIDALGRVQETTGRE